MRYTERERQSAAGREPQRQKQRQRPTTEINERDRDQRPDRDHLVLTKAPGCARTCDPPCRTPSFRSSNPGYLKYRCHSPSVPPSTARRGHRPQASPNRSQRHRTCSRAVSSFLSWSGRRSDPKPISSFRSQPLLTANRTATLTPQRNAPVTTQSSSDHGQYRSCADGRRPGWHWQGNPCTHPSPSTLPLSRSVELARHTAPFAAAACCRPGRRHFPVPPHPRLTRPLLVHIVCSLLSRCPPPPPCPLRSPLRSLPDD